MIETRKNNKINWIETTNPTGKEIKELMNKFDIDPSIGDELLSPSLRPHAIRYGETIYAVFHIPQIRDTHGESVTKIEEIDFVINKDFLVTASYSNIDSIEEFEKFFEAEAILKKSNIGEHGALAFYSLLMFMYHSIHDHIESLRNELRAAEEKIFKKFKK